MGLKPDHWIRKMANCIIYQNGSDDVVYFIKDCVRKGNNFTGVNIKLTGIKPLNWSFAWVEDDLKAEFDEDGNMIGWNKTVSECSVSNEKTEVDELTHLEYEEALKQKFALSYETNEDLEADIYAPDNV